jgi:toluene methyl-monooxygenase
MEILRYFMAPVLTVVGIAGLALGGAWCWLGMATLVALIAADFGLGSDLEPRDVRRPWAFEAVLYLQFASLTALWAFFLWRIGPASADMALFDYVGATISVSYLTGLGGLPAAHELMHRKHPVPIAFAHLYATYYLMPINDLSHIHGHHVHVGTPKDCDTPIRGESIYRFVARAGWGQMAESVRIESARLAKRGIPLWSWRSRILWMVVTEAVLVAVTIAVAGWVGLACLLASWVLGFFILQGFNYTQHYGLIRAEGAPIEPRHSWNHLTLVDRALAYEIATHSGHHLDPDKPYWRLETHPRAPQMPSIILCFLTTWIPPLWDRWITMPRLKEWDLRHASPEERKLAAAANARAGWPDWLGERDAASATG